MSLRRASRRSIEQYALPWTPPILTSPRMVTITDDPATRNIVLDPGQDCFISAPDPITFRMDQDKSDAIIQIVGGGDVVWIGGHITGAGGPITTVTAAVGASDTAITVADTTGFPAVGYIRVDGEGIGYTGKTGTTFTGLTRNELFYNTSAVSSNTTHSIGATVYLGEYSRTGISRVYGTGVTHLEGILIDGFINDGIRANGNSPLLTIQNCRVGPNTNHDHDYQADGHPDVIQMWGGGVQELRVARSTLIAGRSGRAILNAAYGGANPAVGKIVLQDAEFIASVATSALIENADSSTTWEVANAWLRTLGTDKPYVCTDEVLAEKLGLSKAVSAVPDFCPAWVPGAGYVSPGYL